MSFEVRRPLNGATGTLSADAGENDTVIYSDQFAALLDDKLSDKVYTPIVLDDGDAFEIAWGRGHGSGSPALTVARGKEGSERSYWPEGTTWTCAPTTWDAMLALNRSQLPTDAFVGMRVYVLDEDVVYERTISGQWTPSTGIMAPAEAGPAGNYAGGDLQYPPASAAPSMRMANAFGSTDAQGNLTVTYRVPFPMQSIAVVCTSTVVARPLAPVVTNQTRYGFTAKFLNLNGQIMGAGSGVAINYCATGF